MAGTDAIPFFKGSNDLLDELVDGTSEITEFLSFSHKKALKDEKQRRSAIQEERAFKKKQEQWFIYQKEVLGLSEEEIKRNKKLYEKRKKLVNHYDKFIIKNKFFKSVLKGIKSIGKSLANMAKNSFLRIIGFLLAMAFLDPKGKMLMSLLNIFINLGMTILKALIPIIPRLLKTMIDLVVNVLPGILKNIISMVFPMIGKLLQDLSKGLAKDFPILSKITGFMAGLFGKGGILYEFAMLLADNAGILLGLFLGLGAFMKVLPFLQKGFGIVKFLLSGLWTVIGVLFPSLTAWITGVAIPAITGFLASLGAVLGPILLIVGALLLIWKFSDKIVGFFDSIINWVKNLSTWGKIIVGVIAGIVTVLFPPLVLFIGLIYGLAKLFKAIKKYGLKKTLSKIWDSVKNFFKNIGRFIGKIFSSIGRFIGSVFSKIKKSIVDKISGAWDSISSFFGKLKGSFLDFFKNLGFKISEFFMPIFDKISKIAKPLLSILGKVWDLVGNTISKGFNAVKKGILQVINFIGALSMASWFKMARDDGYREKVFAVARYSTNAGIVVSKKMLEGSGGTSNEQKIRSYANKAGEEVSKTGSVNYYGERYRMRKTADIGTKKGAR